MIKVMHVINTLGCAGAENMLCEMVAGMDGARFENEIVSLTDILDQADKMQAIGVRVRSLNMKRRAPNPLHVLRLARWIRESKPDLVHAWMYHSNLVGSLAAWLADRVPVVWGIHHSELDVRVDKRITILVNRVCAFLSGKLAARIVCCSEASLRIHKDHGYAAEKMEVIPNGFNLEQFRPDHAARVSVREELGVSPDGFLIGMAARFHPQKDHRNFVRAAGRLSKQIPNVHFLLCGRDINWQNSRLAKWIDEAGIRESCHLLGVRWDTARLFAAMDIVTTASFSGEAFPIVIGEAMACETPCVVTDVGDSALIVGSTGEVVAPGDPDALAQAWRKLIESGSETRRQLGIAARRRVQRHFALPVIVGRYQAIYAQLAHGSLPGVTSTRISQYAR
jgi:glycosyltransferase involved in cell wall biosynthesis